MKITLVVMYFPPEIGSASHLFFDFALGLKKMGYDVNVITTFPREYNLSDEDTTLIHKYKHKLIVIEELEGIRVARVPSLPVPKDSTLFRGIEHFFVPISILFGGLFVKSDIILVYSPPLPLGFAGFILSRLRHAKLIVNIQDLYPQAAIDLGLIKNPLLIRLFYGLEALIYKLSDCITVHSKGNEEYIAEKVPLGKITVIPNWYNTSIDGIPNSLECKRELGLTEKLIVTYAGIMSYSQDIDTIIEAAILLKDNKDIKFLLVGDGPKKRDIEKRVNLLENIMLLPYQPQDKYAQILAASDICLVTLDRDLVKTPVVPRKLNDIMAAGKVVITNVPLNGDAAKIVKESKCGFCIEPKNAQEMAECLMYVRNNPNLLEEMGNAGRIFAKKNFSLEKCCSQYEQLFQSFSCSKI